eukprot:1398529-Amphidinium_carterae.1
MQREINDSFQAAALQQQASHRVTTVATWDGACCIVMANHDFAGEPKRGRAHRKWGSHSFQSIFGTQSKRSGLQQQRFMMCAERVVPFDFETFRWHKKPTLLELKTSCDTTCIAYSIEAQLFALHSQ